MEVALEANGRLRSETLALEFGLDEAGEPRVYTLAGERLLTHEETAAARQQEAAWRKTAEQRQREAERMQEAAEAARANAIARLAALYLKASSAADFQRANKALARRLAELEAALLAMETGHWAAVGVDLEPFDPPTADETPAHRQARPDPAGATPVAVPAFPPAKSSPIANIAPPASVRAPARASP